MDRNFLEDLRWKKEKVQLLRSQIAELEELMEYVPTTKYSDMPKGSGGNDDRLADLIDKKEKLKKEYVSEIAVLLDEIKQADDFIKTLPERYQVALRLRFYEYKTWFEVADIMGYDSGTIFYWWKKIVKLLD